jgi:hypothetical protein
MANCRRQCEGNPIEQHAGFVGVFQGSFEVLGCEFPTLSDEVNHGFVMRQLVGIPAVILRT